MSSTIRSCQILIKFEFYRQIFEKWSSIKLITIPPVGEKFLHADRRTDGRTDGRTDMTKLIVVFRNFAYAPNNYNSTEFKQFGYVIAREVISGCRTLWLTKRSLQLASLYPWLNYTVHPICPSEANESGVCHLLRRHS
jgi:hypothetical protein